MRTAEKVVADTSDNCEHASSVKDFCETCAARALREFAAEVLENLAEGMEVANVTACHIDYLRTIAKQLREG